MIRPGRANAVVRNAAALMFSTVASSALGMAFWIAAVRLYPADEVGRASAGASAITLLAGLAQLSLSSVFVRFLPGAGDRTGRIIRFGYAAAGAASVLGAAAFFLLGLARDFLPPGPVPLIAFCVAVCASTIAALQDSVLTALRRAAWVPAGNIILGLGKLALLVALAVTTVRAPMLIAWAAPIVVAVVAIGALLVRLVTGLRRDQARPAQPRPEQGLPTLVELRGFMTSEYLKNILGTLTLTTPPLLVAMVLGPEQNAYFYLPWLIGSAALALSWNISVSFVVEASGEPSRVREHLRHAVRLLLAVTVGGGAMLAIAAPLILATLGDRYAASGATSLRLIGLSLPFDLVMTLFSAAAIMAKRTWVIFWAQLVATVFFLGAGLLALPAIGAVGMAAAYLGSHAVMGISLAPATIRRLRALVRDAEPGQDSASTTARGVAPVRARGVAAVPHLRPGHDGGPVQVVFLPDTPGWRLMNDSQTVLMQAVETPDPIAGDATIPMQRVRPEWTDDAGSAVHGAAGADGAGRVRPAGRTNESSAR